MNEVKPDVAFQKQHKKTFINLLTKKWKTKQFNCLAELQERGSCPLLCKHLDSFLSLEHRKSQFLANSADTGRKMENITKTCRGCQGGYCHTSSSLCFLVFHQPHPDKDPLSSQIKEQTVCCREFSKQHTTLRYPMWVWTFHNIQMLSYYHTWAALNTTLCRAKNHNTTATL